MKQFLFLLGLGVLCLFSTQTLAKDSVGTITAVVGDVFILPEGGEEVKPATLNDPVFVSDTLFTDAGEYVTVTFNDESVITMNGMGGKLVIDDFLYNAEEPENNTSELSVIMASFEYTSGLIGKTSKKGLINIDFGSIGIRGTHIFRSMKDMECWIYLKEGEIDVMNEAGQIALKAGEGTRLSGLDVEPMPAQAWEQNDIDWITGTTAMPGS